jgi:hypothetical protein
MFTRTTHFFENVDTFAKRLEEKWLAAGYRRGAESAEVREEINI